MVSNEDERDLHGGFQSSLRKAFSGFRIIQRELKEFDVEGLVVVVLGDQ